MSKEENRGCADTGRSCSASRLAHECRRRRTSRDCAARLPPSNPGIPCPSRSDNEQSQAQCGQFWVVGIDHGDLVADRSRLLVCTV